MHGVNKILLAYARREKVSSAFWSGFASSGGYRMPFSSGIGASVGIDGCYTW